MSQTEKAIKDLLIKLLDDKFYGKITVNYKDGKIVNVVKEESIKLVL